MPDSERSGQGKKKIEQWMGAHGGRETAGFGIYQELLSRLGLTYIVQSQKRRPQFA
jgi:hypothetical protein